METQPATHLIELRVSPRYVRAHGWVVNAITGWLSAYYMEDPRFRVSRRYEDLETGAQVWVCELEDGLSMPRLLKRLQADIPLFRVHEQDDSPAGQHRYVIDLPDVV
ncbi:MAG: hypothetical protein ACREJU_03590 [Nitrospiraceae bacterium]